MDVRWSLFCSNFLFMLPYFFHFTATFKQQGGCLFPERWKGTWFQSGVQQPIIIDGPRLSSKGRCLRSEGDKFLVVNDKTCYRCVVIHEKHANVLQYKETYCYGRESLTQLCSLITGDALLYSMFRENAQPVPCPFRGPFSFTYNRGHGECKSPVSSIDACTEESRLLLSYQACPDVHGSESIVEELQCLAVWKEGSARYLVGKVHQVHHSHATSNEDRFRCFVYEKASAASEAADGVDFRVAQSGDATCNGLFSATDGSRTMTLRKAPSVSKCRFPSWLAYYNHWHTLDYSATYSFHHRNSTLRITSSSGLEMRIICAQISPRDENIVLTHFTMGCQSGFACMSFLRRDDHVMEVQMGLHTKRQEDACTPMYFNKSSLPYITLVTSTLETRRCPYVGKFQIQSIIRPDRETRSLRNSLAMQSPYQGRYSEIFSRSNHAEERYRRIKRVQQEVACNDDGFSSLVIGCTSIDTMEFRSDCPDADLITSYSCHGLWKENETYYLITTPLSRASHSARRFCFIYRELSPELVLFSTSTGNCDRSLKPGNTGELVFNVTNIGNCMETNAANRNTWKHIFLVTLIVTIFFNVHR